MISAQRILASLQIVLGLSGMILCGYLYNQHCDELQDSLQNIDSLAGDVDTQAEIGDEMLEQWSAILRGFDNALDTHSHSLMAAEESSDQLGRTMDQWDEGMVGFNRVVRDAERICLKFADQLPIKIPNLDVKTRPLTIDIPTFEMQTETAKIPYPTARVGSRKMKLDVGLTDLEFDVPTLNVGTRNKVVNVPSSPKVNIEKRRFSIPDNVEIVYQELFRDEKDLLTNTADQLGDTARLIAEARETLDSVDVLVSQEIQSSIAITAENLRDTQQALKQTYEDQIPEVRQRLASQQQEIRSSQLNFRSLKTMVPWLFLLAAMLPAAIAIQGFISWLRASPKAKANPEADIQVSEP